MSDPVDKTTTTPESEKPASSKEKIGAAPKKKKSNEVDQVLAELLLKGVDPLKIAKVSELAAIGMDISGIAKSLLKN